jgi:hypothetical protein
VLTGLRRGLWVLIGGGEASADRDLSPDGTVRLENSDIPATLHLYPTTL